MACHQLSFFDSSCQGMWYSWKLQGIKNKIDYMIYVYYFLWYNGSEIKS